MASPLPETLGYCLGGGQPRGSLSGPWLHPATPGSIPVGATSPETALPTPRREGGSQHPEGSSLGIGFGSVKAGQDRGPFSTARPALLKVDGARWSGVRTLSDV